MTFFKFQLEYFYNQAELHATLDHCAVKSSLLKIKVSWIKKSSRICHWNFKSWNNKSARNFWSERLLFNKLDFTASNFEVATELQIEIMLKIMGALKYWGQNLLILSVRMKTFLNWRPLMQMMTLCLHTVIFHHNKKKVGKRKATASKVQGFSNHQASFYGKKYELEPGLCLW